MEISDPTFVAPTVHGPTALLAVARVYFSAFEQIYTASRDTSARVNPIVTLVHVISAAIDISAADDKMSKSSFRRRVLDTALRGEGRNIDDCIALLVEHKYISIDGDTEIIFFEKFFNSVADSTTKMLQLFGEDTINQQSRNHILNKSRIIYDYYCFRFLPEWYLLIKRVLQSSNKTREGIDEAYERLFRMHNWIIFHFLLIWLSSEPIERTIVAFRAKLSKVTDLPQAAVGESINALANMGFFKARSPVGLSQVTQRHVKEYELAVTRHYGHLLADLKTVSPDVV